MSDGLKKLTKVSIRADSSGTFKESLGQYRRVLRYLEKYRGQFFLSLFCMIVYGASEGALPFIVKYALDDVFAERRIEYLYAFPIVLLAISCVRAAADFGQQFLTGRLGHNIVRDIRNDMVSHILRLGPTFFLRNSGGDVLSRTTSDVQLVRSILTDSVSTLIRDTIRILALIAAAIYLDSTLAMIACIALPLGVYPIYTFGRRLRRLSRRGQEGIGQLSSILNEVCLGSKVVKIFGAEEWEERRFASENERITQTFVKSEKVKALSGPVNEILASLAISGVVVYGGWSVIDDKRTQGDFIAFLMAVFLLYDPFKKLGRLVSTIQQGMAGATRIFEFLDYPITINDPERPAEMPTSYAISFEQVSFAYEGGDTYVLSDLTFDIKQGERVALVGFSGAGKSTLVDLIPRFIDPQLGRVCIGGVDVRHLPLAKLRSLITMVSQHTFLFNTTIRENVVYGNRTATDQEVRDVLEKAYALEFVDKLPDGLDTMIGEGGFSLSGGERQRITIARAMLKNSPILILDEATASLDNRAEAMVQQAIERLEENRTSIVIAHRLSTIQDVDRVVVMKDGKIVEVGTSAELLEKGGEFSQLYSYQFSSENGVES